MIVNYCCIRSFGTEKKQKQEGREFGAALSGVTLHRVLTQIYAGSLKLFKFLMFIPKQF